MTETKTKTDHRKVRKENATKRKTGTEYKWKVGDRQRVKLKMETFSDGPEETGLDYFVEFSCYCVHDSFIQHDALHYALFYGLSFCKLTVRGRYFD